MGISSFLSSVISVVHADAPQEKEETQAPETENKQEESEPAEVEEEEEEPEDAMPAVRDECQNSGKCAALAKHFEHCQEKVNGGEGFKGEDCVEELMMHCVDDCSAPKLFAKLR